MDELMYYRTRGMTFCSVEAEYRSEDDRVVIRAANPLQDITMVFTPEDFEIFVKQVERSKRKLKRLRADAKRHGV